MTPLIGNTAIDENGEQIQISVKGPVIDENGNFVLDKRVIRKQKLLRKIYITKRVISEVICHLHFLMRQTS